MTGVTDVLAIYGAVLSTIAVVWNLCRDVHNRSRELRKKLTADLYSPVRRQLTEASEAIEKGQRVQSINPKTWKIAYSSGITRKLKRSVRSELAELYEWTLPHYDKAWRDLNEEIRKVMKVWDELADIRDFQIASKEHHIVEMDWWKFLTADSPVTPINGLRDGVVLSLWDAFMTPSRFKLLDLSPERFLIHRWQETSKNDALKQFRDLRKRALVDICKVIALLDRSSVGHNG